MDENTKPDSSAERQALSEQGSAAQDGYGKREGKAGKTAQETRRDILVATNEHREAIKSFLAGLGYRKIFISCDVGSIEEIDEKSESSRKLNCLHITAHYE